MAMKQFNLEEYLKNPSKKVITRDGQSVKIHCTNFACDQPVIATIGDEEYSYSFSKDGMFMRGPYKSRHDLFFAPARKEGWTPVYRDLTGNIRFGYAYSTKKEAEEASKYDTRYLTTTRVEWEE